jgi:GTP 3',8-cyclase
MLTYAQNYLQLRQGGRTLAPVLAVYYLTTHCNLNCAYCEDFGARRNPEAVEIPDLEQVLQILGVIRTGMARLWLTGGEPLLVPHLPELLSRSRTELKFRAITLILNGTLLADRLDILPHLDRLVISLDSLETQTLDAINLTPLPKDEVLNAIERAALR